MNKYNKIQLIRKLGLNTENSILIKSVLEFPKIWKFINSQKAISLRTLHPINSKVKTPHYPIVKRDNIENRIKEILNNGFYGIVAYPIDPKDAMFAGAALLENNKIYLELAKGTYTVRRVTHEGIIDYKLTYPDELPIQTEITNMITELKKIPFNHCIAELSYYHVSVGWKHEHVIIWDINDDGTKLSHIED